jgi:hypothetical protein
MESVRAVKVCFILGESSPENTGIGFNLNRLHFKNFATTRTYKGKSQSAIWISQKLVITPGTRAEILRHRTSLLERVASD